MKEIFTARGVRTLYERNGWKKLRQIFEGSLSTPLS
jgi:hypothetical protein